MKTLKEATQEVLDAYEKFRERDDLDALDEAMTFLAMAHDQLTPEQVSTHRQQHEEHKMNDQTQLLKQALDTLSVLQNAIYNVEGEHAIGLGRAIAAADSAQALINDLSAAVD